MAVPCVCVDGERRDEHGTDTHKSLRLRLTPGKGGFISPNCRFYISSSIGNFGQGAAAVSIRKRPPRRRVSSYRRGPTAASAHPPMSPFAAEGWRIDNDEKEPIFSYADTKKRRAFERRQIVANGFYMEARGFEPRSETRSTTASTCVFH
jgi:hypothetical protein